LLLRFIEDVKAYTGSTEVDIVAHSLGVSMTLAALTWSANEDDDDVAVWNSVRRFIDIAGGLRGLCACVAVGYANPLVSTCGSQNLMDPYTFGFYPDTGTWLGRNAWTAERGTLSLRRSSISAADPRPGASISIFATTALSRDAAAMPMVSGTSGLAARPARSSGRCWMRTDRTAIRPRPGTARLVRSTRSLPGC
jgi:hypothetical protein